MLDKLLCRKREIEVHELRFMNLCTEGSYQNVERLDKVWREAERDNETDQILNAIGREGNTPL